MAWTRFWNGLGRCGLGEPCFGGAECCEAEVGLVS